MPLTLAQFRARFPGFDSVDDTVAQSVLDEAARRTPASVWGDQENDAHGYLAAGLLWNDTFGGDSAIANGGATAANRYLKMRARLESEVAPGVAPRVT